MNTNCIKNCSFLMWYAVLNISRIGPGMVSNFFSHYRLQFMQMPTISIWDLFFVKKALYGFHYFKYAATLAFLYHTILLKIKVCLMTHPLKFVLFLWQNDVLSFKDNDITTLIVEGGWASDDNNSSFGEQAHANSGTIFYNEDRPEILK